MPAQTTIAPPDSQQGGAPGTDAKLLGIGAAAARAGVSERALRYYQEIGLLTPTACTPGGLRRYSEEDLSRVARIRELQTLLGLNLDEIKVVLRNEDRMAEMRVAYGSSDEDERRAILRLSLTLHGELRSTVEAKRVALDDFLADLDARMGRIRGLLGEGDEEVQTVS